MVFFTASFLTVGLIKLATAATAKVVGAKVAAGVAAKVAVIGKGKAVMMGMKAETIKHSIQVIGTVAAEYIGNAVGNYITDKLHQKKCTCKCECQ